MGSIWRPLFFEFPKDEHTYTDEVTNSQFMIGSDMMSAPIIYEGRQEREVYFPSGKWYDLHTGKEYAPGEGKVSNVTMTSKVPLFVREGRIVPLQDTYNVTRVAQLSNSFILFSGMTPSPDSNLTHQ